MSVASDNHILFCFKIDILFHFKNRDFNALCINKLYVTKFKRIFVFKAIPYILNKG